MSGGETTIITAETPGNKTLRERLNEGRIPALDGLSLGVHLAGGLRAIHDRGAAHGSITPDSIVLTAAGVELLPPPPGTPCITPYTAPEVACGRKPADGRSDVFSFGAILFEILTGRQAFTGGNEAALAESISTSPAPHCGNPAVDRVLDGCLAKDPENRWQWIQKVQIELRLLIAGVRRTGHPAQPQAAQPAPAPHPAAQPAPAHPAPADDAALRIGMAQLEGRLNASLQAQERRIALIESAVNHAILSLRGEVAAICAQLVEAQAHTAAGLQAGEATESAAARFSGELRAEFLENIDQLSRRIAYLEQGGIGTTASPEDISRLEAGLEKVRHDLHELHANVAADFQEFETNLKTQATAIASARTAISQTDELVEHVVGTLDSLQASLLKAPEKLSVLHPLLWRARRKSVR